MTPLAPRFAIGTRFGHLEILEYLESDGGYGEKTVVRVRCDCGRRLTVESRRLNGRASRYAKVVDCGEHDGPKGWRQRPPRTPRQAGSTKGLSHPGVMATKYGTIDDPEWPVAYMVVAAGKRTVHDTFEEAAAEFRLRRGTA